jgi:hypothetical protein
MFFAKPYVDVPVVNHWMNPLASGRAEAAISPPDPFQCDTNPFLGGKPAPGGLVGTTHLAARAPEVYAWASSRRLRAVPHRFRDTCAAEVTHLDYAALCSSSEKDFTYRDSFLS